MVEVEINVRHNSSTSGLFFLNRFMVGDPFAFLHGGRGASLTIATDIYRPVVQWLALLGEAALDPLCKRGVLPIDTGRNELSVVLVGTDNRDRERLIEQVRFVATAAG